MKSVANLFASEHDHIPVTYNEKGDLNAHPDLHPNNSKPWSGDELQYLIEFYHQIGCEEMTLALGRSTSSVRHKYRTLCESGLMQRPTKRHHHDRLSGKIQ
jgi:hypothetical protein